MAQVELASWQVSRRSVPWMLAAVVASLLPHVTHLPPWVIAVCVACIGWRWAVHRGLASYPPQRLQTLFAALLIGGVLWQYHTVAGHVAGTALLVAMYSLKLLEMYKERDAYVVILIGYFVAAMAFLFHFSVWMAFYVVMVCLLFTTTLVAVNTSLETSRFEPFKRGAVMLLQSVPVAVLLFVVMPRLGPLWATGLKPSDAVTGVSGEMSPGSVGNLARSRELAFRVDFDGPVPPSSQLYWRGLTLAAFDGTTWRQLGADEENWMTWYAGTKKPGWLDILEADSAKQPPADVLRYSVVLQPTQQPWLFALAVPQAKARDIGIVVDQRLRAREPVKAMLRYDVITTRGLARDLQAPEWFIDYHRHLPADGNPRARRFALDLRAESAGDDDYVDRVLAHFRDGGFAYTLTPPVLSGDIVDQFLFESRRGFCEHYASTFVYLMRAAGIPARVVVGYQGGEVNDLGGTVQVHQYDAHAWAEIWQAGRGWREIDPTAVVSPERIAEGSRSALGIGEDVLGINVEGALGNSLRELGNLVDYLNHGWNRWVLGFDEKSQANFLKTWLGSLKPARIALLVGGVGIGFVLLMSLWMFRDSWLRRRDPVAGEYERFCRAWSARGHERAVNEGPWDYLNRLSAAEPKRAAELRRFIALYVGYAYGGVPAGSREIAGLRRARMAAV